jgi:hypothetical protein
MITFLSLHPLAPGIRLPRQDHLVRPSIMLSNGPVHFRPHTSLSRLKGVKMSRSRELRLCGVRFAKTKNKQKILSTQRSPQGGRRLQNHDQHRSYKWSDATQSHWGPVPFDPVVVFSTLTQLLLRNSLLTLARRAYDTPGLTHAEGGVADFDREKTSIGNAIS